MNAQYKQKLFVMVIKGFKIQKKSGSFTIKNRKILEDLLVESLHLKLQCMILKDQMTLYGKKIKR